ncbi:MAG: T9SS type A sorting domain-containing protein [candidate division WOR-3 bacterium]|nr:T9SS type A sorting domain-containing protein [candidate division WOR-3 bacterium]
MSKTLKIKPIALMYCLFIGVAVLIAEPAVPDDIKSPPVLLDTGTVYFSQNFDGTWSTQNPPPGWEIFYTTPTQNSDWHRKNAGESPWSDNSTPYACLYYHPPETGEDILKSPIINCSGLTNVVLRCSTFFVPGDGSAYTAKLQGSSDGGSNWVDLFDYRGQSIGPGLQTFACPWATNNSNVRFRWYWSGNTNQLYHWSLDNVAVTGDLIIRDVGVVQIIQPTGTVDSSAIIMPQAMVRNYGNVQATFPVIFRIGTFYADTQTVVNLSPGQSKVVNFNNWVVSQRNTHTVKCTTAYAGDMDPTNDYRTTTVTVKVTNVGVEQIVTPAIALDSSGPVMPQARVKNYGTSTETFNVTFKIDTTYSFSRPKTLESLVEDTVNFPVWVPTRGTHTTRCSTFLAGDVEPRNDTMSGSVTVRVRDAGVMMIVAPNDSMGASGVIPQAWIRNYGTYATGTFNVRFDIIPGYTDIQSVPNLTPGDSMLISFAEWVPTPGTYVAKCTTMYSGDANRYNDSRTRTILITSLDVGVSIIVTPNGTIRPDSIVPQAWIKNYGTDPSGSFGVKFDIVPGYSDTQWVSEMFPGDSFFLSFEPWVAILGSYDTKCSTMLTDDDNNNNDFITGSVTVSVTGVVPGTWLELPNPIPGLKPVKYGGCMGVIQDTLVYVVKGNKTFEMYRMNTNSDSWQKMTDIPQGPKGKPVKKGAQMVTDGERYIYFTKGTNTLEFFKYDAETDSWSMLPDVPVAGKEKRLKGGTGMAYVEKDDKYYVYLLKGSKTFEFYRLAVETDSWQRMADAPFGELRRGYKKGSDLAYDPENGFIYCLKDKSNEMFRYDVMADSWGMKSLPRMPFTHRLYGKTKKVKGGGALCFVSSEKIFAFKGGNTPEFWLFNPLDGDSGVWSALTLIPQIGSSGRKKRVKDGSDLVVASYDGNRVILAMKGNKTSRLWLWADSTVVCASEKKAFAEGVYAKRVVPNNQFEFNVMPNPVKDRITIFYNLPKIMNAKLKLYNVIGKLVDEIERNERTGMISIDRGKLPAGVYLVKLEAEEFKAIRKIILAR